MALVNQFLSLTRFAARPRRRRRRRCLLAARLFVYVQLYNTNKFFNTFQSEDPSWREKQDEREEAKNEEMKKKKSLN